MCVNRCILLLLVFGVLQSLGSEDVGFHTAHRLHSHKNNRRHRATTNDDVIHFEPEPYSKKLELNSSGKIHCKVAGGVAPNVTWYLNDEDHLPEGMSSTNGTLLVPEAARMHAGTYTCRAVDGQRTIEAKITLDIVVSPRVLEPTPDQQVHVEAGSLVALQCRASGDPPPATHWDRNRAVLHQQEGVEVEGGVNASTAKFVLLNNGTLVIRNVSESDADQYGCTAGNAAGLVRNELQLIVHREGEMPPAESSGVAGKAVVVSISVAGAYMILVLALMIYCRRRRLKRRQAGEKLELEMVEGQEKLVEDEEDKKVGNGVPAQNGRLLPHDRDSGADNSEVSAVSRISKKSGQFDHLTVPRTLLTDQIQLGRGEFGEVLLAKIDMTLVKKLKSKDDGGDADVQHVLVKALTTKDEVQLAEFRRQIELFSRCRHDNIARLIGLCNEREPHYMLLQHTDWGDLKSFLFATRTPEETEEYLTRIGPALPPPKTKHSSPPLLAHHRAVLAMHLATAAGKLAAKRITHRDIAARNCLITSKLQLKLSYPALSRGPDSHEYYKLHDQVIPLRWLPSEVVTEGEYSTKSDVYMFAATIWEVYTKAELPFAKLNDNSVLERLKNGTLEWNVPNNMPESLSNLLKLCWQRSPSDRPQFVNIIETMAEVLKETAEETTSKQSQELLNEE